MFGGVGLLAEHPRDSDDGSDVTRGAQEQTYDERHNGNRAGHQPRVFFKVIAGPRSGWCGNDRWGRRWLPDESAVNAERQTL